MLIKATPAQFRYRIFRAMSVEHCLRCRANGDSYGLLLAQTSMAHDRAAAQVAA